MPYNKKNTGDRNQGKSFDKKRNNDNPRNSGKDNKQESYGKRRAPDAPGSGRGDERKSYNPMDKNELAPPRFLPPPPGARPYPSKRNDSRSFHDQDKKRTDNPYSKGRFDDKRSVDPNMKRPSPGEWGKDDLANSKYFKSGEKKSYNERPSDDRPRYDRSPRKEGDERKPFKPAYDKPGNSFNRGKTDNKGSYKPRKEGEGNEGYKPRNEGDERKAFKPKYETEVKGKKPYHEKSVKTPNERKRELLGTVDEPTDIRLNKYIANSGICARREADELIKKGLVTVNGNVVTEMGLRVKKEDIVKYEGRRILPEPFVYVLMNKPKDFITTTDDEKGRKTVMDLLTDKIPQRIYPIGRLDRNTTGVLLLTNDGEVAQALTHPTFEIKKIYHVVLDKKVTATDLDKLVEGVTLEDGLVFADAVSFVDNEDKSHVGVEIHSGKNRVVRRMFEHLGYEVEKLDRVSVGIFTKKDLPRGKWRYLNQSEVGFLMKLKSKMQ